MLNTCYFMAIHALLVLLIYTVSPKFFVGFIHRLTGLACRDGRAQADWVGMQGCSMLVRAQAD